MEVISLCPLPVAGLLWSTEQRGWSLTIVCKATFVLAPGELSLRREQLGLNRTDKHFDEEPMCSVYAPADLAPFKPFIDVIVVGHGYAASKTAQAVTAGLEVGAVHKKVRVYGARTREADGTKGPTASFKKIALRYERAVGGAGMANPVGIPPHGAPEPDGSFVLPNLELVDGSDDGFAGFGPVAASWPTRRKKLGRHADGFSIGTWWEEPFPAELDLSFFNAAPPDQQLENLKPGDTIKLSFLHPEHATLEVSIPKLCPQAFLELADGEDELLTLRCDTVWIDTDEGVVTLTWRGHVRLEGADVRGRCFVAASNDGTALSKSDLVPLLEDAGIGSMLGPPSLGAAIGLGADQPERRPRGRLLEVEEVEVAPASPATLASLRRSPSSEPPASEPPLSIVPLSAPPSMLTTGEVVMISSDQLESIPPSTDAEGHELLGPKIVKLIWADRSRVHAIRGGWRELLVADEPRQEDGEGRQGELRDVHRVLVSAYPASAIDIEGAVAEAVGREQEFESPLVLSSGDLRLTFDELAVLRATVTAASPFASGQFELEQMLTAAKNMLGATWLRTADGVAAELTGRIRDTFSSATRSLPPGYLEAQALRIVVAERRYQRRDLWGRRWLRAAFTPVHSRVAFVAYLPEDVAEYLPLFDQFFARVIAHVDLREDQFETHPLALKVCAIARVLDAPLAFSRG